MMKSYTMGITLLVLTYGVVLLAEIHYLAFVIGITWLAFVFLWCVLDSYKNSRQVQDSSTTESSNDFMLIFLGRCFQRVII